jgi:lysophospholipase L1-like esterase
MTHDASDSWFRSNPKKTLVATAAFGVFLALGLAELAVRVLYAEWASTQWSSVRKDDGGPWVYDPLLGWSLQPGYEGRFVASDFSIAVSVNGDGIRDDEYSLQRTDRSRMLVLGDSFAWGWGVEHEQRFSELLEARNSGWEIVNAAVPGYGTDQIYLYLREKGIAYRPDVILLLFYYNDFVANVAPQQYDYNKPFFALDANGALELRGVPVPTSTIRQRAIRAVNRGRLITPKLLVGLRQTDQVSAEAHRAGYPVTFALIRAIDDLTRENSARFALVSVPMPGAHRKALREFTQQVEIPHLPLDRRFSLAREKVVSTDGHWNPAGHRIAAEEIQEFLRALNLPF